MATRVIPTHGRWIGQVFTSQSARNGGIVRRKVSSVKKYATIKELKAEVKRQGFHMLRSGDQFLIFCHQGDFRVIC
jgi:hypothetical protein